jgi:hypothetical protein
VGSGEPLQAGLVEHTNPLLDVVVKFNASLLAAEAGGRNTLISRLAAAIQVRWRGRVV